MNIPTTISNPIKSSFLSCEKDAERIIKKLFVENKTYSDFLKRLLVINTKDCIDLSSPNNTKYQEIIDGYSVGRLLEEGYISLVPKIQQKLHEEAKSYIIISFDDFTTNSNNPEFRDCAVNFDIICNVDNWDIGDYRLRPIKIAGYIDGLLNNIRLTGIGTFQFFSCCELMINEQLAGYTIKFFAIHGGDDKVPDEDS